MSDTPVIVETADGRATVTLNRPEVHNAFDEGMIGALTGALRELDGDDAVRVVVLTGAGKSFSAGGDLNWMKRTAGYSEAENVADAEALAGMMAALAGLSKPTVAAVHGAAMGGGVGLVAASDIAIAADDSQFALSEVKLGLIPAVISTYVVAAMGERQARRYMLTAERFDAHAAMRVGLVHSVVPKAELAGAVDGMIEALLANGPAAMAEAKALVRVVAGRPIDARLGAETARRIARLRASDEGREGVAAFLEKRLPAWRLE